jgi:subtilisin family serine protease
MVKKLNGEGKRFVAVWAAGNEAIDMDFSELSVANLIVVGAYCFDINTIASSSSRGAFVDIYVPGVWTGKDRAFYPIFDAYGSPTNISGTSYAAPIVTGVISLMWELNPDLSPSGLKNILLSSAVEISGIKVLNMLQGPPGGPRNQRLLGKDPGHPG